MSLPKDLKYTRDHEWLVSKDGSVAAIGVTGYAIEQLGDIVHIELPKVGDSFAANAPFGTIESTKTVSDLYCPVAGKVVEVNDSIKSKLESLAGDPYEKGWLIKVKMESSAEVEKLMSAADYETYIAG